MKAFTGTFEFKVDAKGRVSIPAAFRNILVASGDATIYAAIAPGQNAIRCLTAATVEAALQNVSATQSLVGGEPSDEEILVARMQTIEPDSDGRVTLPRGLLEKAGITTTVTVAGRGRHFEIWEPAAFLAFQTQHESRIAARHRPSP
ncbi:MAG: hypothetical protein JNK67_10115 [Alphaproteobacteria bacterium]|nr:hypothetical protein [Alphaproteobacteria bacterium]